MAARQLLRAAAEALRNPSPAGGLVSYSRALAPFPFGSFYIDWPTIRPPGVYPLPVELLAEIISHIHEKAHLKALCCVSLLFRDLAEPQLYHNVWLYSLAAAQLFEQSLQSRPARQKLVRRFTVAFDRQDRPVRSFESLPKPPRPPAGCFNLEELQVASNGPTSVHHDYVLELSRLLRLASLQKPESQPLMPSLTVLRLDMHPLYHAPYNEGLSVEHNVLRIFFSPTLREITLRHAKLSHEADSFLKMLKHKTIARQTPLRLLHLKHCVVDPNVIQKLLLLPRALDEFHLDQSYQNYKEDPFPPHPWGFSNLAVWTQAFMQQAHALKEIAIVAKPSLKESTMILDLRGMQVLEKVRGDVFTKFPAYCKICDHVEVVNNWEFIYSLPYTQTRWDTLGELPVNPDPSWPFVHHRYHQYGWRHQHVEIGNPYQHHGA